MRYPDKPAESVKKQLGLDFQQLLLKIQHS